MCMQDANDANGVLINFVQYQVGTNDKIPHAWAYVFT